MKFQHLLELYLTDVEAIPGELEKAVAAAVAEFQLLPPNKGKSTTPKSGAKSKYPLKKARVASMTGEVRTTSLKPTSSGWCRGVLTQYDPAQTHPYVIE